jgi:hypothetical protein
MFRPDRRSRSQHSPNPSRTLHSVGEEFEFSRKRVRVNAPENVDLENIELCDVQPISEWSGGGISVGPQNNHVNVGNVACATQQRNIYGSQFPGKIIDAYTSTNGKDALFQSDRLRHLLMLMDNEEEALKYRKFEPQRPDGCRQLRANPIPNHSDLTNPQWGTSHPDFGRNTARAKFTHIEVQWIGQFCTKLVRENPWMQSRMLVECLHALRLDFKVHKYFHPRHVTDAGRLRPGLEAFEKAHGKIA